VYNKNISPAMTASPKWTARAYHGSESKGQGAKGAAKGRPAKNKGSPAKKQDKGSPAKKPRKGGSLITYIHIPIHGHMIIYICTLEEIHMSPDRGSLLMRRLFFTK
jgi:hypothetical protein